jgi:hypothetical protein
MSIGLSGDLAETFGSIQYGGTDKIRINATNGEILLAGTSALKFPVGTTAQRPASPVAGDTRYNTTNTAMEFYNGTSWRTVGALDGSSSALSAPSAVYLRDVAGVTQNGTYWITVNGTPTQIYCNFTTAGGGWMSFASAPGSGGWFSGDTGLAASWTGLSYSFGTYSSAGSIGNYWRNYSTQSVSQLLFLTGNGSFWISIPISHVVGTGGDGSSIVYTSGVTTSGTFPANQYNANSTVTVMHRSPNAGEDPWINAGNVHGNGGNDSGTDYMFWGENGTSGHNNFKNANAGIIAFVR